MRYSTRNIAVANGWMDWIGMDGGGMDGMVLDGMVGIGMILVWMDGKFLER